MKIFLFVSILLASSMGVFSQDQIEKRSVYLKDGSKLIGQILSDTDYAIEIVLASGDTLEIGYKHIAGIGESNKSYRKSDVKNKKPRTYKNTGILFHLSLGPLIADEESQGLNIALTSAKRINSKLNIGGGIGYTAYPKLISFNYTENSFLPIYAYSRYYVYENKTKFYVSGKMGYGISLKAGPFIWQGSNEYNGGIFGNLAIGAHFSSSKKIRFTAEATLNYQNTSGILNGTDWNTQLPFVSEYDIDYIRPGVSIGIEF